MATKTNAAVIGITESWLDDSVEDSEVEVCGYTILRHDRNIRSDISFSPRTDLQTDNLETVWAEVLLPETRPILTGICYRPPRQSDFVDLLELSINEGHCLNECILLGDFNTDIILLPTDNVLVSALRNFEHAFGLKQLIVEPTRVCINKASAIDLILVSDPEKVCQSGVLCVGISDHLLTYCTRKVTRAYVNKHKTILIRSSKKYSQEQFIHNLNETDWTDVLNSVDADLAWVRFKSIFFIRPPFKTIRIKQRTQPWMATEMIKLINLRDNYLRQFRKSNN